MSTDSITALVGGLAIVTLAVWTFGQESGGDADALPAPSKTGGMSLTEALARRRSIREYTDAALTRQQIAQLCWAAQGVTEPNRGLRTAPSAGATYPLELYVVTAQGVHRYDPDAHALREHLTGDVRAKLRAACLGQRWVGQAPASFVFAAVEQRTGRRYGQKAWSYVLLEAGHAAQNLLLQATALDLGGVPIGAMREADVAAAISLPKEQKIVYLVAVGCPAPGLPK